MRLARVARAAAPGTRPQCDGLVGLHAGAEAGVAGVAPERLRGEAAGVRVVLQAGPRALVAVLGAARVGPAGARERIALGSPCSWPATIETPSSVPGLLTLPCPHDVPASGMYGRLVNAIVPPAAAVELCHAQYCTLKPIGMTLCGSATMCAALGE